MSYAWSVSAYGCVLTFVAACPRPSTLYSLVLLFAVLPVRKPSCHHGVGRAAELHLLAVRPRPPPRRRPCHKEDARLLLVSRCYCVHSRLVVLHLLVALCLCLVLSYVRKGSSFPRIPLCLGFLPFSILFFSSRLFSFCCIFPSTVGLVWSVRVSMLRGPLEYM